MANFRQTYVGGVAPKAPDLLIGPARGVIGNSTWQIEVLAGSGAVGSYAYQVSDGDDGVFGNVDTKSATGLYPETRTESVHRIQVLALPDPGTTVRVTLFARTLDEE